MELDKTRKTGICASHIAWQSEYTDSFMEVNYCPGAISGKIFPKALILHKRVHLAWFASILLGLIVESTIIVTLPVT